MYAFATSLAVVATLLACNTSHKAGDKRVVSAYRPPPPPAPKPPPPPPRYGDAALTDKITGITSQPGGTCFGEDIVIQGTFPETPPPDTTIYFERCGVPAQITSWSPTEVKVAVPPGATNGCVWFGKTRPPPAKPPTGTPPAWLDDELNRMVSASKLDRTLANSIRDHYLAFPPPKECEQLCVGAKGAWRNLATVLPPPAIEAFRAVDATLGNSPGPGATKQLVDACTPTTIEWIAPRSTDIVVKAGNRTVATNKLAQGQVKETLPIGSRAYRLDAKNRCGTRSHALTLDAENRVEFASLDVSVPHKGLGNGTVDVTSTCKSGFARKVKLQNLSTDRVSFPESVTIPAYGTKATVAITNLVESSAVAAITQPFATLGFAPITDQGWPDHPTLGPSADLFWKELPKTLDTSLSATVDVTFGKPCLVADYGKQSGKATVALRLTNTGGANYDVAVPAPFAKTDRELDIGGRKVHLEMTTTVGKAYERGHRLVFENVNIKVAIKEFPTESFELTFLTVEGDATAGSLTDGTFKLRGTGLVTGSAVLKCDQSTATVEVTGSLTPPLL